GARRALFTDTREHVHLEIHVENARERLLAYDKDNRIVRYLLAQRCKLHALAVLEGLEDREDGYGALAALGAAVSGHGEAQLVQLRKTVFNPQLGNNMDPDVFLAQYTAAKLKLASYGEVMLENIERSQIISGLGSKYAPVEEAYYYHNGNAWTLAQLWEKIHLCHSKAKQREAATRSSSPAYGAVETADEKT
ncbi:unnamed protein product, partial [Phaeothamnion confervicola]